MMIVDCSSPARELRREFDALFAAETDRNAGHVLDLLAIRVRGVAYAIRLNEIATVLTGRPVTALPGPAAELLGLTEAVGAVVPVYDLALLLGHGPSRLAETPRWMVVARAPSPVCLAFEELEGHLRVSGERASDERAGPVAGDRQPNGQLHAAAGALRGDGTNELAAVAVGGRVRPILDLQATLSRITARADAAADTKDR
jgi:purine-binding chemotaxis protein CheW